MGRRRILFVHGLDATCRAREVAYEFERYGPIVRCDIPAVRHASSAYAFVEFEDYRDAEDAYHELHGKRFDGGILKIQWAKRAPSRVWRDDERRGGDSRSPKRRSRERSRSRSRSRSPLRRRDNRRDKSRSPMQRDKKEDTKDITLSKSHPNSPPPLIMPGVELTRQNKEEAI